MDILVVDDEELLREVVVMMLESLGHNPIPAANGIEALGLMEGLAEPVDLVIMDFSMPQMNGYDTFRKMQELQPDLQAVMYSGIDPTEEIKKLCETGVATFVSKPFYEEEIVAAISALTAKVE